MGDIDQHSVERAYARWAPVYDLVFGAVFDAGRRASIAAAEQACGPQGGRILEVGVGTGISLPDYARANHDHAAWQFPDFQNVVGIQYGLPIEGNMIRAVRLGADSNQKIVR